MRKIYSALAGVVLGLAFQFDLPAQTTPDTVVSLAANEAGLQLLSPDEIPSGGTFWLALPGPHRLTLLPMPFLTPMYQGMPVYEITDGMFLVDGETSTGSANADTLAAEADAIANLIDQEQTAADEQQSRTMLRMLGFTDDDSEDSGGGGTGYTFDTNQLWLEITNVSNGWSYLNLHNATNQVYAIWTTTNLLNSWNVEMELWPTDTNCQPFTVQNLNRQYLFVRAEDWTGVYLNGLPCWWTWLYFGNLDESATDLDFNGNPLGDDYTNGVAPGTFSFSAIAVSNNYVNSGSVSAQLAVAGSPYYVATLVDDTNFNDAVWNTYTSSNVTVNLGTVEGWHDVWVGLRGHADNATNAVWQWKRLKLDFTAPQLVITGPTSGTVNVPVIQLMGFSPEALGSISYDLTNAAGTVTNQQIFVLDQHYDTNAWEFTTNMFQAFDLPLTNGLNAITLHATDLAGNVTTLVTNFTLDYSGKTNPPVLSLAWPQNGVKICGTNFVCDGLISDPTATIIVQLVDTNGDTNIMTAAVGRDGNFFAEYLPLSGGTNYLTLTATDAAGNIATTNLMVVQSDIGLAIDSVSAGQTTVAGEINSSDYTLWVNGVQATNNGDGTWTAQIASIGVGGGTVEAMAIPNSDNGGDGSGGSDASGNPNSTHAQGVQMLVKAPEGIYFSMYQSFEQYDFTNDDETMYDLVVWHDGQGGSMKHFDYFDWDNYFPTLYAATWPATSWPQPLTNGAGTEIDWNLSPTNLYYHPWSTTNEYVAGSPSMIMERCQATHSDWWAIAQRQADSQIKLATGGRAGSTQMNLWVISASATAINPPWNADDDLFSPWTAGASTTPIDPSRITVLGKTVGSDGNLYLLLPDNTNLDATPVIAEAPPYYTYNVTAQKYKLHILANSYPLAEDRVRSQAYYCVGQQLNFNAVFSPSSIPGLNDTSPIWNYTADYVNNHWTDAYGCEEYNIAPIPAMSNPTTAWFYNKQTQNVMANLGLYCKFNNGQSVYLIRQGQFNVFTPTINIDTNDMDGPPVVHIDRYWYQPMLRIGMTDTNNNNNLVDLMAFYVNVSSKTNFPGEVIATQLINRDSSIDGLPLGGDTSGSFCLDGGVTYPNSSDDVSLTASGDQCYGRIDYADGPGFGIQEASWASINDHFKTYCRFCPSGTGSIYVTLGRIDWDWSAAVDYTGLNPFSLSSWSLISPVIHGPTFNSINEFPQWECGL